ncbi:related to ATG11 - required for mitophagy [Moesziomyces antarcticus]|uniref:Autophagy-related protein 11 n=1 Tax=Pseudozyma antarctica TaxID=84753 RepID=A0A5C3FN16_PSEA2|nr:related to ATG11 - required for mitophagy [Moesziomyces antarcticus]
MRVVRAHDGRSILVNQPLSHFASLDDLLDCFSLATEIPSDAIICMASDGSQLKQELLDRIVQQSATSTSASSSTVAARPHPSASTSNPSTPEAHPESHTHEFFVYNRDFLYTDPTELAAELAEHAVLDPVPPFPQAEIAFPPTPKSLEALVTWTAEISTLVADHEHTCRDLLSRITLIARSLQVALANLRDHADNIENGAKALIDDVAQKELTRMNSLLQGYERDLRILGMVSIHPRLQSSGAQMATTSATTTASGSAQNGQSNGSAAAAKPKHRTLGDYISKSKMSAVADACQRVFTELRERIERIDVDLTLIRNDTQGLSDEVEATTPEVADETYQRVAEALARTRELQAFIESTCSPDAQGWPVADKIDRATFDRIVSSANELLLLNEVVREAVQRLTQDRNDILERSLHLLVDISGIQSEFTETGSLLAAVDADLHSNKLDGFKHLHRLKNMLWAYGATVVEVVRRREFAKHFLGKSQSLAELMAKLSASEWKRRQFYRNDVSSLLPWEVKGMDDKPPSLEITTPRVSNEGTADLSLADLQALYELLDQVDLRLREEAEGQDAAASPIPEVKAALQSLAAALQDLDDEFIHLVNLQLLNKEDDEDGSDDDTDESGSDTSIRARKRERRRQRLTASLAAANDQELAQLRRELAAVKAAKDEAERALKAEGESRALGLKAEIETLKRQLETGKSDATQREAEKREAQDRIDTLVADLEVERERRLNMVDEVNQLRRDLEQSHRSEAEAKQEAMEDAERVAELEAQAHELHVELEEAKVARIDASKRIEALLSEGSSAEDELRTAQARIDELTEQLSNAHAEAAKARETTAEIEAVKERQIRSYRAEADGDRAILEEKVRALKADLDAKVQLLQQQTAIASRAEQSRIPDREAIELLRGQLQAADVAHEEIVKEMDRAKEIADEAEASRRDVEASRQQLLERTRGLLAKVSQLRKTVRAMPVHSSSRQASSSSNAAVAAGNGATSSSAPAGSAAAVAQRAIAASTGSLSASDLSESQRQAALDAFEAEAEGANFETTLDALRAFDAVEMYNEVKAKLDSLNVLVRKWQKAWKSANDKVTKANAAARDKIAFRNFQSGDLALFLPTRNSNLAAKPWAAFNISFPHFFLNAKGPLAEQLRTKEWIVARITTITDCVVPAAPDADADAKEDEAANPFRLPAGVRYFLLDVETYSGHSSAPQLKSRKSSSAALDSESTSALRGSDKQAAPAHPRSQSEGTLTGLQKVSNESQTVPTDVKGDPPTAAPTNEAAVEAQDARGGSDEDKAGQTSGFSLRSEKSEKLDVPDQPTPPMQTPDTSPHIGSAKLPDAAASASVADSRTAATSAAPASALTRAIRSTSPAASMKTGRWRAGSSASASGSPWAARGIMGIAEEADARNERDGDASSATGSTSHRTALIEHATLAPAFGRPNKHREGGSRGRIASPSSTEGGMEGRGVTSAPASQTRSEGIAIRVSRPLRSELVDTAVSNPFSQSPGPASLPAGREGLGTLGRSAQRKSSLNIATTAATAAPSVQRWPGGSDGVVKRSASSASTASNAGGGIRINGRSILVDTLSMGRHQRQTSASSAAVAATSAVTAHAVPGAFPSSFSSSGSLAEPASPQLGAPALPAAEDAAASPRKPSRSFFSQTLGRLSGVAAQTVGPPFAPAGDTAREARKQPRPSLFAAVAPFDEQQPQQPQQPQGAEGGASGFSNASASSAEGLLKRVSASAQR